MAICNTTYPTAPHGANVGAAEGCDLLILLLKQHQKIAACGSSYRGSVLRLEEAGEEGGHGGFDAQDTVAELHRLQAGFGQ